MKRFILSLWMLGAALAFVLSLGFLTYAFEGDNLCAMLFLVELMFGWLCVIGMMDRAGKWGML